MPEFIIYPKDIAEVFLGDPGIEGYVCSSSCIKIAGYIAQEERRNVYVYCDKDNSPTGSKPDCAVLVDFLKIDISLGVAKSYGKKQTILKDLLELIGTSDIKEIKIPIKIDIADEFFSYENIRNFLNSLDTYDTEMLDIEDDGFVLGIKRVGDLEKEPGLKDKLMSFFSMKK